MVRVGRRRRRAPHVLAAGACVRGVCALRRVEIERELLVCVLQRTVPTVAHMKRHRHALRWMAQAVQPRTQQWCSFHVGGKDALRAAHKGVQA